MGTIQSYIKQVQNAKNGLLDQSDAIVSKHEKDIVQLFTAQINQGQGYDDQTLNNSNDIFTGVYSLTTQRLAARGYPTTPITSKIAGDLYNFQWTGNFVQGLQLQMTNDRLGFYIFSSGIGTGEKADFFKGYTNMFGLTSANQTKVNDEIMLPEILDYLNAKI